VVQKGSHPQVKYAVAVLLRRHVALQFIEVVIAKDVVGFCFRGRIGRCDKLEIQVIGGVVVGRQGPQKCFITVFLAPLKVNFGIQGGFPGSEGGFPGLGNKPVEVVGDISEEGKVEVVVDTPGHMGLQVEKAGIVLALFVEAAQEVAVCFVTDTGDVRQPAIQGKVLHMSRSSQEAGRCRCPEVDRAPVFDVENTRHLVPVFRLEASCREFYR